ncbi:MAG: HAMP domain-containing sensor histidine kinase [Patescibacteria group bacterium]
MISGVVLFIVLIISASQFNLKAFDVYNCYAVEGLVTLNIVFALSFIIFLFSIIYGFRKAQLFKDVVEKKEVFLATIGISCFLLFFSGASYFASIANLFNATPDTFLIEQYGYFGMTIFIAFLTFIIVQYKAFNIKLIATQALVVALVVLIGSQFFFIKSNTNKVLNGITLVLSVGAGILIVRSVKKEIEAKEALAVANTRLRELDKQKTEFVSFATHQLRSPLTAMKGSTSLILEGDLGPLSKPLKGVVDTIYTSINTMISVVESYLNISRIELGTMKYNFVEIDFKDLLKEVVNEQKPNIEAKGLKHTVKLDERETYKIKADPDKFKQVVMNIIDNSVKYTKDGSVSISLAKMRDGGLVRLTISDTGAGIAPNVLPKLFQKFSRAEHANEANIHGTGLGLYIAKEIMNAHDGRIWAESAGEGKGSQFYVEVPGVK